MGFDPPTSRMESRNYTTRLLVRIKTLILLIIELQQGKGKDAKKPQGPVTTLIRKALVQRGNHTERALIKLKGFQEA